jgi:hypothetical protein
VPQDPGTPQGGRGAKGDGSVTGWEGCVRGGRFVPGVSPVPDDIVIWFRWFVM